MPGSTREDSPSDEAVSVACAGMSWIAGAVAGLAVAVAGWPAARAGAVAAVTATDATARNVVARNAESFLLVMRAAVPFACGRAVAAFRMLILSVCQNC